MSSDERIASPEDIVQWSRQAAAGEEAALQKLLWSHRARLQGYTVRKIGPDWRGRIDPEDVLQEAFVDIFRSIGSFTCQDEDSFYHWSTRIIDHTFIDLVRSLRRKKRDWAREIRPGDGSGSRHEAFLANLLQESATASRILRKQDAVSALMACIAKLPDDYRTVVQRHLINEEPLSAVATDLGRSEDAVRRLAGRAVAKLAACMESASRFFSSHD